MKLFYLFLFLLTFSACSKTDIVEEEIIEICNEDPILTHKHSLSYEADIYLNSFIKNNEIVFINIDNENEGWRWTRSEVVLNREYKRTYDMPCEEDKSLKQRAYASKQVSFVEYEDPKNNQTFKIKLGGVFNSTGIYNKDIIGVLGELLEVVRSSNDHTSNYHIINYFITEDVDFDNYACAPGSSFYESLSINGYTLSNVLTMDVPSENDHYKIYFNKKDGIVFLEEFTTGKFWRNSKVEFDL